MAVTVKRLPKVYVIRHGQTEWSLNGRHTGTTDIPLTPKGEELITALGLRVVGKGRILDPDLITKILVSPRTRAQKTFELLFAPEAGNPKISEMKTTYEGVREWTYGDFEGALVGNVNKERRAAGRPDWDIWTQGCEGGESVQQMSDRVDEVVQYVRKMHNEWLSAEERKEDDRGGDVVIVSHGHFSRCFVARWLGLPLKDGQLFTVDVGGVSIGDYYHRTDRPCLGALNAGSF
ncbi:phosphoglycerate mutase-like protein [Cystobasidium minutum MCA 4210]|uniref:phosphoglycerate mutase-like protein n=1 Tax=Cystobasidium minutum MCA 4210 TaxID=1397322 RepID=UPI0034CE9B2C|eukprot:jgi/Rhomi1/168383/fgenesh1_kg.2_\